MPFLNWGRYALITLLLRYAGDVNSVVESNGLNPATRTLFRFFVQSLMIASLLFFAIDSF